jgi:hypothetical protein
MLFMEQNVAENDLTQGCKWDAFMIINLIVDTLFLIDALETVSLNPPPGTSYPQPGPSRLDQ